MRETSFAIFAEGATYTDLRGRDPLTELWSELSLRVCSKPVPLHVFGISKAQIVALGESPKIAGSREPLDVFIERMHRKYAFDAAVIAFDRIPTNQLVPHDCMRGEVNFILDRFVARKHLSAKFLGAAQALLDHYKNNPRTERGPGHPPRNALDILYMDPMFEGLLTADESSVMHALGLGRRPKGWPKFDGSNRHPDRQVLGNAVKLANAQVRGVVRGDMNSNKHGWALRIIKQAPDESRIFRHPIAQRLGTILM